MPSCNLSTAPLAGSRFAVVVSRFSPLHVGLEQRIYDLASHYDGVILVLASRPDPADGIGLDSLTGMSARNRYRYLREAFNDDPAISPKKLIWNDEETAADAPAWIKQLKETVLSALAPDSAANATFTVVTDIHDVDRTLRNAWEHDVRWTVGDFVDGSDDLQRTICDDPHNRKYWSVINHTFRREFTTVVLVVGSASVGKTTMVTRLSKLFDAPIAVEYAREFEESCNVDDDELTAFDYQRLILSKFGQNEQALASDANHGIVFLDTDAMVTKTYVERYLPPEEAARLDSTFDMVIRQERPDLVLVIPPVTKYVDDGFRAMQWASDRYRFHETLMKVLDESPYADRVVMLDDKTFAERDAHAIRVIAERTGFTPRN
ncbi:AAA family ATPase [Bifidobacterium amazonense]|uniref:AAA family ATPase n=1 Tax=Bifidobacterium amazonense TaxID=2809027 RepID=A0ABS9VXJ4_9BIFI|nr:AAA family ATPase [Bifidobacterium amazonense]MCH9276826.1 AAA family ATPase [Bifidobacterium amazonense]